MSCWTQSRAIRLIAAIAGLAVGRPQAETLQAAVALVAIAIDLAIGLVGDAMTIDANFAGRTIL